MVGARGDVLAVIFERGCASGNGFDAVFAGFCAEFRRVEQGFVSGDVRAGMY